MGLRGFQKGTHGKYRDDEDDNGDRWMPVVHKDKRYTPRAYAPGGDDDSDAGSRNRLAEESLNGDWEWKPARNARLRDSAFAFRGVPPNPSEARPRGAEAGARFFGEIFGTVGDFQDRAIAAHHAAGDAHRVCAYR